MRMYDEEWRRNAEHLSEVSVVGQWLCVVSVVVRLLCLLSVVVFVMFLVSAKQEVTNRLNHIALVVCVEWRSVKVAVWALVCHRGYVWKRESVQHHPILDRHSENGDEKDKDECWEENVCVMRIVFS